jgi:nucleoside-diphosphate-sugar epimerase
MIVAITGGTGFIGRKLVLRHLERGDEVRVLSRRTQEESELPDSVRWYSGNLINDDGLHAFVERADVLYHCAGEIRETTRMATLHVEGTQNLIEAANGRIGRWVQLSSVGVYGSLKNGEITEIAALDPSGEYEITKTKSDLLVTGAANKGSFSCSILRPSNVFGADMPNQSLFAMISMIDRGIFFFIGKPGASANYIHVDNVVEGLIACGTMPQAKGRIYNLSDNCTMEHFVAEIADALGCAVPRIRIPKLFAQLAGITLGKIPGFPLTQARVDALSLRSNYPATRIQQELGYQQIVSMEDGLRELVKEHKQRRR